MPLNILYWNIENFAFNKIAAGTPDANRTRNHILANLQANTPDIFVVVEVWGRGGGVMLGNPVRSGAGKNGVMNLLHAIRTSPLIAGNWFLVPPLVSGNGGFREGIAVFYNNNSVAFTGPNVLKYDYDGDPLSVIPSAVAALGGLVIPGPEATPAHMPGGTPPVAYPVPYSGAAVGAGGAAVAHALPAGFRHLAGKVRFTKPAPLGAAAGVLGEKVLFPNLYNRSPFLTTFKERVAGGGFGRDIMVMGFHSSPSTGPPPGPAQLGTAELGRIAEIVSPCPPNTVQVLVGDFNVKLTSGFAGFAFNPLINKGFVRQFNLPGGATPNGYVTTHLKKLKDGNPDGNYPNYGYMNISHSLDNILTRNGTAAATPIPKANLVPFGGGMGAAAIAAAMGAGVLGPLAGPLGAIAAGAPGPFTLRDALHTAEQVAFINPTLAFNILSNLPAAWFAGGAPFAAALGGVIASAREAIEETGGNPPVASPVLMTEYRNVLQATAAESLGFEMHSLIDALDTAPPIIPVATLAAVGGAGAAATPPIIAAANALNTAFNAEITALNNITGAAGANTTAARATQLAKALAGKNSPAGNTRAALIANQIVGPQVPLAPAPGAPPGTLPNGLMIVNRMVGAPYRLPYPGAGVAPPVPPPAYTYSRLTTPLFGQAPAPGVPVPLARDFGPPNTLGGIVTQSFRGPGNFRKVRKTSDHLALSITI